MRRIRALLDRADRDERGMILGNVLIFGTVLMLLVATMVAVSTSGAGASATGRATDRSMRRAGAPMITLLGFTSRCTQPTWRR